MIKRGKLFECQTCGEYYGIANKDIEIGDIITEENLILKEVKDGEEIRCFQCKTAQDLNMYMETKFQWPKKIIYKDGTGYTLKFHVLEGAGARYHNPKVSVSFVLMESEIGLGKDYVAVDDGIIDTRMKQGSTRTKTAIVAMMGDRIGSGISGEMSNSSQASPAPRPGTKCVCGSQKWGGNHSWYCEA